jgi:hypothetical protein
MKIVEEGEGRAIRQRASKEVYIQVEVRRGRMLSSFYDIQGCRYDTIYRDDIRYRILLQLQSTEWPGWVDEYYEYRLAIFASRCGDKTRKSQKAKVRQGRTRSAVGMFSPSSLSLRQDETSGLEPSS